MVNVLVTGGAGFIGSHLTDYIINKKGYKVVVLDDLSGGFKHNVNSKAEFIEGSITDHDLINSIFEQYKFNYVYHLAAYAAETLSSFIKRFNYNNNLIGSVNLINASVNYDVKCFVFISSLAVYGQNQLPMREDMVPVPEDSYGIAKLSVEMELKITNELFGLDYVIFRPHNVYGERQNLGDKYRNVLGIFMNRIMRGEDLIVFGDGEQRRAFTYVNDIVPNITEAVDMKGAYNNVFNIGADKDYSVMELAEKVNKAMGASISVRNVEERKEVKHVYSDHTKFNQVFGCISETDLDEGIKIMAKWAKNSMVQESTRFNNIEIERNLPSVWK